MRPLTYYVGMSLDGYIAGPNGEVDYFPVSEDHVAQMVAEHPEVLPTHMRRKLEIDAASNRLFDTVIMGRGTYQPALDVGITDPYAHLRTFVVSARGGLPAVPAVTVVTDPVDTVRLLKAEESELGIWLAGGAQLAAAVADEIDRLVLKVYPVLSGAGTPVLDRRAFAPRSFEHTGSHTLSSGCVILSYERV